MAKRINKTKKTKEAKEKRYFEGFGIASFILGLFGITGTWLFAIPFAIVSIIRIRKQRIFKGIGFAIAGLILGLISAVISLVMWWRIMQQFEVLLPQLQNLTNFTTTYSAIYS